MAHLVIGQGCHLPALPDCDQLSPCVGKGFFAAIVGVCVFLASGYGWVTVMHEIPIASAQPLTSLPYPRTR